MGACSGMEDLLRCDGNFETGENNDGNKYGGGAERITEPYR